MASLHQIKKGTSHLVQERLIIATAREQHCSPGRGGSCSGVMHGSHLHLNCHLHLDCMLCACLRAVHGPRQRGARDETRQLQRAARRDARHSTFEHGTTADMHVHLRPRANHKLTTCSTNCRTCFIRHYIFYPTSHPWHRLPSMGTVISGCAVTTINLVLAMRSDAFATSTSVCPSGNEYGHCYMGMRISWPSERMHMCMCMMHMCMCMNEGVRRFSSPQCLVAFK